MEEFTELIAGSGPACSCSMLRGLDTRPKVPIWNLSAQGRSHTESPNARLLKSDPLIFSFSFTLSSLVPDFRSEKHACRHLSLGAESTPVSCYLLSATYYRGALTSFQSTLFQH